MSAPLFPAWLLRLTVHVGTIGLSVGGSAAMAVLLAPEFVATAALIGFVVSAAVSLLVAKLVSGYRRTIYEQRTALVERNDELIHRNHELRAFAHTVAHDLRSPLTGVRGFAELIAEGPSADQWHPDEAEALGREVMASCDRMQHIITDLLVLASVSQQEVDLSPLAMDEIVGQVEHRLRLEIEKCGAHIAWPQSWPEALGHPSWVEQIWVNYLSNGFKYGGSPPELEVTWAGLERGFRFWVCDNGPGLGPEERAQLFREFSRLEPERADGHGLGLWIVHRIVTKLGGSCGVESEPGTGSRFYFDLPRAPYDHPGLRYEPPQESRGLFRKAGAAFVDRLLGAA